jgi:hypothetical protein
VAKQTWNIQYGVSGFELGEGTIYSTTNNPDVLSNLGGSIIYEYYVQAVCANGYESLYTGPVSFTMPLVNDEACDAIEIPMDGQDYFFHNQAATANESSIIMIPDCRLHR